MLLQAESSTAVQLKKEDMNAEYLLANYLDNSNDLYWVDEYATPLSVLEIRDKIIEGELYSRRDSELLSPSRHLCNYRRYQTDFKRSSGSRPGTVKSNYLSIPQTYIT